MSNSTRILQGQPLSMTFALTKAPKVKVSMGGWFVSHIVRAQSATGEELPQLTFSWVDAAAGTFKLDATHDATEAWPEGYVFITLKLSRPDAIDFYTKEITIRVARPPF